MLSALQTRKSGSTIIECVVALAIMAAMLTTMLSIQVVQSLRLKLDNQRLQAEQILSNLADRILTASPTQLSNETLAAWATEAEQEEKLPANTIQVIVHAVAEPATGKRFEMIWQPSVKPLPGKRLVVWRFDNEDPPVNESQP
ncbi:hypothetical protein DTL42_24385 [Bremerella cremea]|uniref:Type II secretion system protein n=1 Tax=Bremerella cremea TaxID=1031537 RepID=A0A368KMF4_9BACT|nr:type II secretion system protein [Bremerella cremea]RCS40515.1 hypothetical protein DTL42_24385 [Bremerella cremea]